MNRLERVIAAVRAWRVVRTHARITELEAAIDDLDAFTKKPTEPTMPAVVPSAADEPPKTDRNS